jgi:hypothetical protein
MIWYSTRTMTVMGIGAMSSSELGLLLAGHIGNLFS